MVLLAHWFIMMVCNHEFSQLDDVFILKIGQHNDSRMNMALIMSAVKHGATVANYCEVTQINKDNNGKLNGAKVKDNLTGEEWNVRAKVSMVISYCFVVKTIVFCSLGHYQCNWPVFGRDVIS